VLINYEHSTDLQLVLRAVLYAKAYNFEVYDNFHYTMNKI